MPYTNNIKDALDILNLNITFNEICLTKKRIHGRICQAFKGALDYSAHVCPHCASEEPVAIFIGLFHVSILLNDFHGFLTLCLLIR
jgi:transposase